MASLTVEIKKQATDPVADVDPVVVDATAETAPDPDDTTITKRLSPTIPIFKAQEIGDRRLVTGPVLIPNVVDGHLDVISYEDVEWAAHNFLKSYNEATQIAYMHNDFSRTLALVESYIAPCDLEINGKTVIKGTWVIVVQVLDDDTWAAVKSGDLAGFSIGGIAVGEMLDE